MQGSAFGRFIVFPAALVLSAVTGSGAASPDPHPPSLVQALHAAEASLRRIPGDDIEHDFRPAWTAVADLDGDGRSEIIYLYTSTYTGGSFAQSNVVAVMTALKKDDPRGKENPKSLARNEAEDSAAIRASGYGDDAGEQIPGAVRSIRIEGNRIIVAFHVTAGARTCDVKDFKHICPADGDHVWTLAWTPGKLTRIH